jgi:hypothetical protein
MFNGAVKMVLATAVTVAIAGAGAVVLPGGFKVYGDQICVYPGGDVFTPDACLRDNGTVTVGGQVLSASDIAWLHQARDAGYIPGCMSTATTGGRGKS